MSTPVRYEEIVAVRLTKKQLATIKLIVDANKDVYEDTSHFIRSSVIRNINKHKQLYSGEWQ